MSSGSMKMVFMYAVTVLFAGVVSAYFDSRTAGFDALDLDNVISSLVDASHGSHNGKVNRNLNNYDEFYGSRDRKAAMSDNYHGHASKVGNQGTKSSSRFHGDGKKMAMHDGISGKVEGQMNMLNNMFGHLSSSDGMYDRHDGNSVKGFNSGAAKKKDFHTGKKFDDDIVYNFDKIYDRNISERGGFEDLQGSNAKRFGSYRNKQKAKKLIGRDHSVAKKRQDDLRAIKDNDYKENTAGGSTANSKDGHMDKKHDKAGATVDDQDVVYDRKDNKYHAEDDGKQEIIQDRKKFAKQDGDLHRQAAASHGGARRHDDKQYQGGPGRDGSLGHHGNTGHDISGPVYKGHAASGTGIDRGISDDGSGAHVGHGSNENAKQIDHGKEHLNQAAGESDTAVKTYELEKNKGHLKLFKSLHDGRRGKFAQGVHDAENKDYYTSDGQSAKSASVAGKRLAGVGARSDANAAGHDHDDAVLDRDILDRKQQDRSENFKKRKRFYHDKSDDGKNYERLNYNRKKKENEYGDSQAANNEHGNTFDMAHKSAQHNAATRKQNFLNAKKFSKGSGRQNANRHAGGHSNNHANNFAIRGQNGNGHEKEISESDFANQKDSIDKTRKDHHDNTQGLAALSANGFRNGESYMNRNRLRVNGNLLLQNPRRPFNSDFGSSSMPAQGYYFQGSSHNMHIPNQFHKTGSGGRFDQHDDRRRYSGGARYADSPPVQANHGQGSSHTNRPHNVNRNKFHDSGSIGKGNFRRIDQRADRRGYSGGVTSSRYGSDSTPVHAHNDQGSSHNIHRPGNVNRNKFRNPGSVGKSNLGKFDGDPRHFTGGVRSRIDGSDSSPVRMYNDHDSLQNIHMPNRFNHNKVPPSGSADRGNFGKAVHHVGYTGNAGPKSRDQTLRSNQGDFGHGRNMFNDFSGDIGNTLNQFDSIWKPSGDRQNKFSTFDPFSFGGPGFTGRPFASAYKK